MGLRDEWDPMGSEIWGRVALKWRYGVRDECDPIRSGIWDWVAPKWRYGAQGWMGSYGMWDLGSGGPMVDIWDRDGRIWGSGMDGALWDLRFGVGWMTKYGDMGLRDEWDPIRSGIWGRVDQRWSYGTGMRM